MNPGGWRTALRIAVREARRAKGRSALVLAMIALPVAALTFSAVSYDTFQLTPAERLDRQLGPNDAELVWVGGPLRQDPTSESWQSVQESAPRQPAPPPAAIAAHLPPGSRIAPVRPPSWHSLPTPDDEVTEVEYREIDPAHPVTRHLAVLRAGRLPADRTEALATEQALRRLGLSVGERTEPLDGAPAHTVVGVVEVPDRLDAVIVVPPATGEQEAEQWLADVPGGLGWDDVGRLNANGLLVIARPMPDAPPPASTDTAVGSGIGGSREDISVAVLVGGLGLLEVVLLAGPALAVGALRRRRDLALVAANGGSAAHLRRMVLADGVLLGGCGAAVGLAVGVVGALAARGLLTEYVFQTRPGATRYFPEALAAIAGLAVVAGVLAALVPAFTTARQDVVAALTGRRGQLRSRRRWLVAGLALAVAGTAVAMFGATRPTTSLILFGLTLAEIGLVLCTPSVVGLIARLGRFLPLAPRIALRDTARNRASAAPAISAVLAAVAGSVALGGYAASADSRNFAAAEPTVPPGYVHVSFRGPFPGPPTLPVDRVAELAEAHLPATGVTTLRMPGCPDSVDPDSYCGLTVRTPPGSECPYRPDRLSEREQELALADPRCARPDENFYFDGPPIMGVVADDGSGLAALTGAGDEQVRRATEVLRAGGVVVSDPLLIDDGMVSMDLLRSPPDEPDRPPSLVRLPAYALDCPYGASRQIVAPATLAGLGLASQPVGYLVATSGRPGDEQVKEFGTALRALSPLVFVEVTGQVPSTTAPTLLVLAGAAGLITLGAAGMATGLAAAEGRADLSTLAAIGASPRVRRLLSLSQAGVIAGLGSLLGMAAGLCAAVAVITALNQGRPVWPVEQPYPIVVPWQALGVLLVVPLVAMLGAGLLTPSRLPIERRLG
ncbi:ABC transporter permease [Solwaraspora sp. WMMD1047]|uniref:FtsX-like permease family protein n=1 Tax=Solwaraspora sp. WMMD1047 TaxID=3016102 RepID=UPI002417FBA6|nr:FtsX-like permease family protein [Solwaraspora sp. WMMD1047]MDG4829658.1 ABC transporter permease [Solwaraspora sp. WMMD1047]